MIHEDLWRCVKFTSKLKRVGDALETRWRFREGGAIPSAPDVFLRQLRSPTAELEMATGRENVRYVQNTYGRARVGLQKIQETTSPSRMHFLVCQQSWSTTCRDLLTKPLVALHVCDVVARRHVFE